MELKKIEFVILDEDNQPIMGFETNKAKFNKKPLK